MMTCRVAAQLKRKVLSKVLTILQKLRKSGDNTDDTIRHISDDDFDRFPPVLLELEMMWAPGALATPAALLSATTHHCPLPAHSWQAIFYTV